MRSSNKKQQPLPGDGRGQVGVTWYENESQWLEMRSTAIDPDEFYDTYTEWVTSAAEKIEKFRQAGVPLVLVPMLSKDFLAWCKETKATNCGASRSMYVSAVMASRQISAIKGLAEC
jgi:hypothetical protein